MSVVSIEEFKRNRTDDVELRFTLGHINTYVMIVSTDNKRRYLDKLFPGKVHLTEFENLIDNFKESHPNLTFVDF